MVRVRLVDDRAVAEFENQRAVARGEREAKEQQKVDRIRPDSGWFDSKMVQPFNRKKLQVNEVHQKVQIIECWQMIGNLQIKLWWTDTNNGDDAKANFSYYKKESRKKGREGSC